MGDYNADLPRQMESLLATITGLAASANGRPKPSLEADQHRR